MREVQNQSLGSQLIEDLNLSDTIESARGKVQKGLTSLGDRLQGIITGQRQQPAQAVIPSGPAMGSRDPSREIGPLAQTIPTGLTNQDEVAAMAMRPAEMIPAEGMPAESDPRLSDTTTADMLRDPSFAVQSDPAMSFTELAPQQEPQRTVTAEQQRLMDEISQNMDAAGLGPESRINFLNDIIGQQVKTTYSLDGNPTLTYTPEIGRAHV